MKSPMTPIVLFFLIVNALAIVFGQRLRDKGIDTDVVMIGNLILALTSAISVYLYAKGKRQTKGHGAVRNIYGGFMLKFFVLIVAMMVYFFFSKEINKGAIFVCMGLYLVYSVIGTRQSVKNTLANNNQADQSALRQKHHPKHQHHAQRKK